MDLQISAYVPQIAWGQVAPFAILTFGGLLILGLDALLQIVFRRMTTDGRDRVLNGATAGAILVAGALFYANCVGSNGRPFFEGMLRGDEFANLGALIVSFASLVFVAMCPKFIRERRLPAGELYALLLFAVGAMTLLAVANELITAFICIEILSLALYVLAGIDRRSPRGSEAAFKYFILGAFASAFLVLGIAFVFGATGTTQLFGGGRILREARLSEAEIGEPQLALVKKPYDMGLDEVLFSGERAVVTAVYEAVERNGVVSAEAVPVVRALPLNPVWLFLGFALVFAGLCFKLSLAPFHMWAPDVYEGAPAIVTMLIATASKVAAFAFLIHLIEAFCHWELFPSASLFLLGAVAVASILWGNIGAVVQTRIKRMLAYSSIAHGGYMVVGIATLVSAASFADPASHERIRNAIIFYLFGYTVMNVLAFGIAAYLGKEGEGDIASYCGLAKRRPMLAAGMALAMISLLGLGIPGTIGFWGKYFVIKEAVNANMTYLAWVAFIGSAISAYYYLRVVVAMYMLPERPSEPVAGAVLRTSTGHTFVLGLSGALVVFFGLLPALFWALGSN